MVESEAVASERALYFFVMWTALSAEIEGKLDEGRLKENKEYLKPCSREGERELTRDSLRRWRLLTVVVWPDVFGRFLHQQRQQSHLPFLSFVGCV